MHYPACSEAEEFVGEAAGGEGFLYGGIVEAVISTFCLLTCRFDPLDLFGRRGRRTAAAVVVVVVAAAAAAAVAAAGVNHCHRGSERVQPRVYSRLLRWEGGRPDLWSGWAAASC